MSERRDGEKDQGLVKEMSSPEREREGLKWFDGISRCKFALIEHCYQPTFILL